MGMVAAFLLIEHRHRALAQPVPSPSTDVPWASADQLGETHLAGEWAHRSWQRWKLQKYKLRVQDPKICTLH